MSLIENGGIGRFEPSAFYNEALPYRVTYQDPEQRRILGPSWRLENFVPVKKSRSRTVLEVGARGQGQHDVALLEDGDDLERRFVHPQDLRFVHPSGAQIW